MQQFWYQSGPPAGASYFPCGPAYIKPDNHFYPIERVTGRKARGLQMEEIGCKYKTFLSILRAGGNKLAIIFPFSIQI